MRILLWCVVFVSILNFYGVSTAPTGNHNDEMTFDKELSEEYSNDYTEIPEPADSTGTTTEDSFPEDSDEDVDESEPRNPTETTTEGDFPEDSDEDVDEYEPRNPTETTTEGDFPEDSDEDVDEYEPENPIETTTQGGFPEDSDEDDEPDNPIETTTQDGFPEDSDEDVDEYEPKNPIETKIQGGFPEESDEDDDEYEPENPIETTTQGGFPEDSDEDDEPDNPIETTTQDGFPEDSDEDVDEYEPKNPIETTTQGGFPEDSDEDVEPDNPTETTTEGGFPEDSDEDDEPENPIETTTQGGFPEDSDEDVDEYEPENPIETTTQDGFPEDSDEDDEPEIPIETTTQDGFSEDSDEDDDEYEPKNPIKTPTQDGFPEDSDEDVDESEPENPIETTTEGDFPEDSDEDDDESEPKNPIETTAEDGFPEDSDEDDNESEPRNPIGTTVAVKTYDQKSSFAPRSPKASSTTIFVGTYTGDGPKDSKGIYAFSIDDTTSILTPLGLAAATPNPSYVLVHPTHKYLYAANEQDDGKISAFKIESTQQGRLTLINQESSRGSGPCYLSTNRAGGHIFVANYNTGTVAVLPIDGNNGSLKQYSGFDQHRGSSVDSNRQRSAHAHCILLDKIEQNALSADLGSDQIYTYRFFPNNGSLLRTKVAKVARPGSGPRHLVFNSNQTFVYVMNELKSTITVYNYLPVLHSVQTISTLPNDFKSYNTGAEILLHPVTEKYLYASNRGHDSIAVFTVDNNTGYLSLVQHISVQGRTPRNFNITPDGKYLIVANQDSNNLVVFSIDHTTGKLTATGSTARVSRPTCIKYLVQ